MHIDAPELRVLIADDHPVYRDGLAVLLGSLPGIEVVGTASDGVDALAKSGKLLPDVVVMDIQMPDIDGIQATRRLRQSGCSGRAHADHERRRRGRPRRDARRCAWLPRQGCGAR